MVESFSLFLQQLGISLSTDALFTLSGFIFLCLGIGIGNIKYRRREAVLKESFEQQREQEQSTLDDQLDQLSHAFSSLSQRALQQNSESFINLANQSFARLQSGASGELKAREQSFANLLKPLSDSIQQTDAQLKKLDKDREVSEARLSEQISNLLNSHGSLQAETRNLVSALRRPEVRGQWGELTLKRLVELAGMSEYCDFQQQVTVQSDDGLLRPDMVIRLPSERQLVVDVKTPLDAYISATEATDAAAQDTALAKHSANVKQRIKELGQKQYWQQFERSPDFIILFIPGDQFLSAALDVNRDLLEFALERRVLLATPTSLVGLLRAIAYGWNQDLLNKNSDEIRNIGEALYQRLQTLTEHLNKLGKNLDQSMEQYNKVIGSFEANALPAARRLSTLGINASSEIDSPKLNTGKARQLQPDDNDENEA